MKKDLEYRDYKKIFDKEMNSGKRIFTLDNKEELIIEDNERWKQCYKPGVKAREQLPQYWFVSSSGNLISVYKGKACWLKKDECNGRYSYHFNIDIDGETTICKNIEVHNLVGIVFGSPTYGIAKDMLDKQGLFAFGIKNSDEVKINGHHTLGKEDNSPESIEFVSTDIHKVIDKVPKKSDTESEVNFLKEFGSMVSKEVPDKASVLLTGQKDGKEYSFIDTTNKLKLSGNAMQELLTLQNGAMSRWLIDKVTEMLLKDYGLDYFTEPKYLSSGQSFYRCEKGDEGLYITEIEDISELADKNIIMCCINEDGQAEFFIDTQEG